MFTLPQRVAQAQYDKHHKATAADWNVSRARTASENGPAQYNPLLYGTRQAAGQIEYQALAKGKEIFSGGNFVCCYVKIDGDPVGACSGRFTNYLYVEMTVMNGVGYFHGYPISEHTLHEKYGIQV
jgi:hypothetical protein